MHHHEYQSIRGGIISNGYMETIYIRGLLTVFGQITWLPTDNTPLQGVKTSCAKRKLD